MTGLWVELAIRLLLVGAMVVVIAGSAGLLRLGTEDRVQQTAFGWAVLIFVMLVARAAVLATTSDEVTAWASRVQYTLMLLQVPLSLQLIDSRAVPKHRGLVVATALFALLPLIGESFATDRVVRHQDALSLPIAYAVPGILASVMVPYGLALGAFIAVRQRHYVGPDSDVVRLVLMCVILAVVPAGVNDLLMTVGAVRSVLLVDVASSLMVLGLGNILSRRAQDAHVELVRAIDVRRAELARGAADMRTTSRTAALGAEVTRVLGVIREPVRRIVSDLVSAEDAVLAVPANGDRRWLEEREVLAECRDAASRVQKTIDAFAELTDAGSPRSAHLAEVDVRALIDRALSVVSNEIRHRARLVKEIEPVPLVVADADRLVQAFVSLFVRALRAIPETESASGRVGVKVSSSKGRVIVRISDNGAKIPESLLPLVFDPYVASEPDSAGSGLGLALCHRIVTRAGGRVTLESGSAGTDVLVELPTVSLTSRARGHHGAPASPVETQAVGMQTARPGEP